MGWPLAVSAALMEKRSRALLESLGPLGLGHLAAMLAVLLPFAMLVVLVQWHRPIRIAASVLVLGFGIFRLCYRRHPRGLARIRPTQLGLWSFAVALAHGAGLMLLPIYLGMCRAVDDDAGHAAAGTLVQSNLGTAFVVALVHSGAMLIAGGTAAWLIYRYFGLTLLGRVWLNLEVVWALSLIGVGAIALYASAAVN